MKYLNPELIRTGTDRELLNHAMEILDDNLDELGVNCVADYMNISPDWSSIYSTFRLESQVCNGGFHQFFWNSKGEANDLVLRDLIHLRANTQVAIFKKALAVCIEFNVLEQRKNGPNTWFRFTRGYKTIPWDQIDSEYFKANPRLEPIMIMHIKENQKIYTEPQPPAPPYGAPRAAGER